MAIIKGIQNGLGKTDTFIPLYPEANEQEEIQLTAQELQEKMTRENQEANELFFGRKGE